MKKKEWIFIVGILVFAGILWTGLSLLRRGEYGSIEITVEGEVFGTYSLAQDQTIKIGETNVLTIKDGKAKMTEAECPDHLCMKQHAIDSGGGTIVCLPNKVVITGSKAKGADEPAFDTVV